MTLVNFEEWANLEMRIGKVKDVNKNKIIINCNNEDYSKTIKINAKKNDLIVVGFLEGEIIIPLINGNVFIIPESDIEVGSKIR